jgi:pimeloyl-ACP methyl ester carboxylesterase
MIFYSGFCLKDDERFFKDYLSDTQYSVGGFSYGAIKALEYALKAPHRIDRLQLFSPAFFQNKEPLFKRMQLLGFKKNPQAYIEEFIKSCFAPYSAKKIPLARGIYEELKELIEYEWDPKKLKALYQKGVIIEIFIGGDDAIIDARYVKDFFQPYGTVYFINRANHFLQQE